MRNLKKLSHAVRRFREDLPLGATAWETSSQALLCAFGPSPLNPVIDLKSFVPGEKDFKSTVTWDSQCPLPDLQCDKILSLHHLSHIDTSCLVLEGGDLVLVKGQPLPGEDKINIVGSVDAGITAASWSPDEELLAVTTRANTLLLMTTEFENISNTAFTPEDARLSKHVSVGWGKSETQFKGKRARALRDPTMPETVDEGTLSPLDQGEVTISWRGDGAFVAVNSIDEGQRRMIRVFTRDGVLDSVSEPVDGLEGTLSWKPSGSLIAGIQRKAQQVNVVFFERNGLRHGEFPLRIEPDDLSKWATSVALQWNSDSSVLAIRFQDRVQLWTMGNYHYYLKQEITLPGANDPLRVLETLWHPEDPLRIAISGRTEELSEIHDIRLLSAVAGGPTALPHDFGLVAVIDGCKIKLTPLRNANVPPPMALHEIDLRANAIDVAVNSTNTLIAVLHETQLSVFKYNTDRSAVIDPPLKTTALSLLNHEHALQVCFRGEEDIYVLISAMSENSTKIWDVKSSAYHLLTDGVAPSRLFSDLQHNSIFFECNNVISAVEILQSNAESSSTSATLQEVCTIPAFAPWIEVTTSTPGIGESIVFALTTAGVLFANDRVLLRNCTSFLLTDIYLILTTTNHLLKFVNIDRVSDLEVPSDEPESDERCRSIEKGAKLVTVVPTTYSLTLQMPRGNLETIYPRALVLAGIRKFIAMKDYKRAFMACRNQRVDMNILYDHDPIQFLHSTRLIVQQLDKVEYLDLFIAQLRNEDVSKTIYRDTSLHSKTNGASHLVEESQSSVDTRMVVPLNKVNKICDALIDALGSQSHEKLQNSITAHVCKVPPDLDAGLTMIIQLRQRNPELTDAAVEHICFLADVNQLYNHALGLYDLELALLIAQQSQLKDPREYLPYLQKLQEITPIRLQFTIDDDLGKHTKALGHLHILGDEPSFHEYILKHQLYQPALELTRYNEGQQKTVLKSYASFLSEKNRLREAGIAFESLSDYGSASEAYKAANLWKESLACAGLAPLTAEEITALAASLAEDLIESKDFHSAAQIHLDYLSDAETATRLFCKGYYFSEAFRIASMHKRPELLTSTIDTGLIEGSASTTELLADCKSQLQAQVPRLRELRQKKAEDPLAFYDGEDNPNIPDNVSLAPTDNSTTGGSLFTRYTNRTGTIDSNTSRKTSKNRRREERKRARGKKGSVYEEEYLVNSISRLIERVNSVGEEVERLVEGLLRRCMRERATAVEVAMEDVTKACQECLAEVFEVAESKAPEATAEEENRPPGADGVLWDSVEAAKRVKEAPLVKAFKRSLLLGG